MKIPTMVVGISRSAYRFEVRQMYMIIRLPFRFLNGPYGKRIFTLDTRRIKEFVDISDDCVARLAKVFCPPIYVSKSATPKQRLDYSALATEYQQLLSSGVCQDRADIARHYGVSRAWITKVMKKGNKE
jgi:hypothetical protein